MKVGGVPAFGSLVSVICCCGGGGGATGGFSGFLGGGAHFTSPQPENLHHAAAAVAGSIARNLAPTNPRATLWAPLPVTEAAAVVVESMTEPTLTPTRPPR